MKNRIDYFSQIFVNVSLILSLASPTYLKAEPIDLLADQKKTCKENSAMEWNTKASKCEAKADAEKARKAADDCNKKETSSEREKCHLALASSSTSLTSNSDGLAHDVHMRTWVSGGFNLAYTAIALINNKTIWNVGSTCTSKHIFAVTAVGGIASDAYLKIIANTKVDDLKGKFKLGLDNNASDSQTKALTYLKEEQQTVLEIAEQEKTRNQILTLGYTAAGIAAGYELATGGGMANPDCLPKPKPESTPAAADATPAATPAPVAEVLADSAFIDSSAGILTLSAIGITYSGILWKLADDQVSESKKNIETIDKVLATFKDSYANFCPTGHEDLNEPRCYCYTTDNKQNKDRTKSQTCIDLWAKDSYRISAEKGNYTGDGKFVDAAGCVKLNGQFDEKCTCKKFIDSKGSNACMKTTNITIPEGLGSGFATSSGLQDVTRFSNNSANGNPGFSSFSSDQLGKKAINAKKMRDAVFSKLGPSLSGNARKALSINGNNVRQFTKAIFGEKALQAAAKGSSSPMSFAGASSGDPKIDAILKNAEQKTGLDLLGSGKGLGNKKTDGKEGFNFVSDGSGNPSGAQTQNFPETQKNYNFKNSDISKRDDTSIFEIISNRYVQSGLKRLFDH